MSSFARALNSEAPSAPLTRSGRSVVWVSSPPPPAALPLAGEAWGCIAMRCFSEFLVPLCCAHRDCGRDVVPFWRARKKPKSARRRLKRAIAGISAPAGLPPRHFSCAALQGGSENRRSLRSPPCPPSAPPICIIGLYCCAIIATSQYCFKSGDCEGSQRASAKPFVRVGAPERGAGANAPEGGRKRHPPSTISAIKVRIRI